MYILELNQAGISTEIALFDSIEQGREFISRLKGYNREEIDGFLYETISLEEFPNYLELEFNDHIIPFSKFMFTENSQIDVIWKEIPNLSTKGNGMVSNVTRIDAYSIENEDVKTYIENREQRYEKVKKYLEDKGFEVSRSFFGSEDGEAILYKRKDSENWHFLIHLDPNFTEILDIEEFVKEIILK